jgi:hypothetical protein
MSMVFAYLSSAKLSNFGGLGWLSCELGMFLHAAHIRNAAIFCLQIDHDIQRLLASIRGLEPLEAIQLQDFHASRAATRLGRA